MNTEQRKVPESPEKIVSLMSRKMRNWYAYIRTRIEAAGLQGLDISHGDILYQLYRHGTMSMKSLAQRIERDKSTLTALIRKMEAKNLVKRLTSVDDARVTMIQLTPTGESYRDAFQAISEDLLDHIYRNVTDTEKRKLMELLAKCGD